MPKGGSVSPPDQTTATVLAWIDKHGPATALEVGRACGIEASSTRGRLVMLVRQGLVSCQPNGAEPSRQAYTITAEGRRKAGISDARGMT